MRKGGEARDGSLVALSRSLCGHTPESTWCLHLRINSCGSRTLRSFVVVVAEMLASTEFLSRFPPFSLVTWSSLSTIQRVIDNIDDLTCKECVPSQGAFHDTTFYHLLGIHACMLVVCILGWYYRIPFITRVGNNKYTLQSCTSLLSQEIQIPGDFIHTVHQIRLYKRKLHKLHHLSYLDLKRKIWRKMNKLSTILSYLTWVPHCLVSLSETTSHGHF